jgi:hypothetical protein
MNLKPFTRARTMAVLATALVGAAGVIAAQTTPALADPPTTPTTYVAVGSETTQDVMNAIAANLGGNVLGSWDATGGGIINPKPGCSFARPNGSSEGVAALRTRPNCVDVARSSGGPGSNQSNTGKFVYIPFALDAMTGSVGPATGGTIGGVNAVATNITQANQFTLTDLTNLYKNCLPVTAGGVTYDPTGTISGDTKIDLYVPQIVDPDTRQFWAAILGFDPVNPPSCVHDTIVAGALQGLAVQGDDGTAVATDPNGFAPFSVGQWIGQRNGHDDRRHGAVLTNVDNTPPIDSNGHLNTGFVSGLKREVYNVLTYDRVVNTGDGNFNQALAGIFAGTGSSVCQQGFTIADYGFATISTAGGQANNCGDTSASLRAFPNG